MSDADLALLVLYGFLVWCGLTVIVGLLVGRAITHRDRQVPRGRGTSTPAPMLDRRPRP